MRMKSLNHEGRRKAIWKFIASLIPFLITMPLFIYIFCFTSDKHSEYIEHRYEEKRKAYKIQSMNEERIDSLMTRTNEIVEGDKKDYQYKETQRLLNNTIQDALDEMINTGNGEIDPYKDVFLGGRMVLSVADSIYTIKAELRPNKRQLFELIKQYKSKKLALSK